MKRQYHPLRLFSVILVFFAGLSFAFASEPAKPTTAPQQAKPATDSKVTAAPPADNVVLAPVAITAPDSDGNMLIAFTHLTADAAVAKFNGADVDTRGKRLPAGFTYSLADQSITQSLLKQRAAEVADNSKMVQNGRSRLEFAAVKRTAIPTKTASAAPPKAAGQ